MINFSCELSLEKKNSVLKSNKFNDWYEKIRRDFIVGDIDIQSVDFFGSKVGFIKLKADVKDLSGNRLPGICFIRGDAVAVIFMIKNKDNGEWYCALVKQGRVPIAEKDCFENPAGMLDEERNITGVAIKELQEELGVAIDGSKLEELTKVYTSAGGQDEQITIYSYFTEMSNEEILAFDGSSTGERDSHEVIEVRIVKFNEYLKYNVTATGQLAYYIMKDKIK